MIRIRLLYLIKERYGNSDLTDRLPHESHGLGLASPFQQLLQEQPGCRRGPKLCTFAGYVRAVQQSGAQLTTMQIDPSTFWTGYFGSRPALKILQAQASSDLVSAETVSSLLRLGSLASSAALDAPDAAITQVWNMLAPSSHHDFVTGTSPDCVYKMEQYPMLSLAAKMAEGIYEQALLTVADMIPSGDNEHIVVVHNPVGVERAAGLL